MADFTIANLHSIEMNIAKRVAGMQTAIDTVETDIDAQITRYQGLDDDQGIGAILVASAISQKEQIDQLALKVALMEVSYLAAVFQNTSFTPYGADGTTTYDTMDAFYTGEKSTLTQPLLANEFVKLYRLKHGVGSLAAANCSAPTNTSYGTISWTAGTPTESYESAPVDTTLYAGGELEIYVTTQVENDANGTVTLTLTGQDINGSAWTGTVDIPDASTVGTTVTVTPSIAKTYPVLISAMAETSGTVDSGAITIRVNQPFTYTQ